MSNPRAFKLLGINDDESNCSVCGRQELKRVMWLEDQETGEVFHVGTDCGGKLLKKNAKEMRTFEKEEVKRHKLEAGELMAAFPDLIAYRAKLDELNAGPHMNFAERMEILRPILSKVEAYRNELRAKFPLAGWIPF